MIDFKLSWVLIFFQPKTGVISNDYFITLRLKLLSDNDNVIDLDGFSLNTASCMHHAQRLPHPTWIPCEFCLLLFLTVVYVFR